MRKVRERENEQVEMFRQVMWHKLYLSEQRNGAMLSGKRYFFI